MIRKDEAIQRDRVQFVVSTCYRWLTIYKTSTFTNYCVEYMYDKIRKLSRGHSSGERGFLNMATRLLTSTHGNNDEHDDSWLSSDDPDTDELTHCDWL